MLIRFQPGSAAESAEGSEVWQIPYSQAKPSHQRLQRGKSAVGQVFAAATQLGQRPLKIPRFGLEKSSAPRRASTSMELTALTAGESMSVGVDVSMNAAAVKVEASGCAVPYNVQ